MGRNDEEVVAGECPPLCPILLPNAQNVARIPQVGRAFLRPDSGPSIGASRSGREDLGTETTHEEQGSHKPGAAPSRDAAIDHAEQDEGERR